jgi:hypothetical protein
MAGGRWSVGRAECCGPVRLGSRDPLSGVAGGGLDSHAWSWGPVTGRLGGCVALPGAAGPGAGAGGHGLLPGADWAGAAGCRCCPALPRRCEPGPPGRASGPPAVAGLAVPGPVPRAARCAPVRDAGREPPGSGLLPGPGPLPGAGPPLPGAAWPGASVVPLPRHAPSSAPRHAASSAPRRAASSESGTGGGRDPGACSPGISAGTGPSGSPAPARLRGGRPSCRSG